MTMTTSFIGDATGISSVCPPPAKAFGNNSRYLVYRQPGSERLFCTTLTRSANVNPRDIPCGFVYENPTINALARYVFDVVFPNGVSPAPQLRKVDEMLSMLKKYSAKFPTHKPVSTSPPPRANAGDVVLITGTTGSIGSTSPRILWFASCGPDICAESTRH